MGSSEVAYEPLLVPKQKHHAPQVRTGHGGRLARLTTSWDLRSYSIPVTITEATGSSLVLCPILRSRPLMQCAFLFVTTTPQPALSPCL